MTLKIAVLSCLLALAHAAPQSWMPSKVQPTLRISELIPRITYGEDARPGEFPHQVSMQIFANGFYQHWCGGSIISDRWVLTAGHCITDYPTIVKAGKINIDENEDSEQVVEVVQKIVHEAYVGDVAPYDIALLKLESPLKFNNRVGPIRLPKAGDEPTGEVIISGWGSVSTTKDPIAPSILQRVNLVIVDRETCNATIHVLGNNEPSKLHNTNICTASPVGKGTCNGDSGGPLIQQIEAGVTEVVGVVSWGFFPCGIAEAPSVFVKVADFIDWIESTVAKNSF